MLDARCMLRRLRMVGVECIVSEWVYNNYMCVCAYYVGFWNRGFGGRAEKRGQVFCTREERAQR